MSLTSPLYLLALLVRGLQAIVTLLALLNRMAIALKLWYP